MGTLMVGGRTRLRPQEARFERKLINPIKVYNENQLMRLRLSWLEPLARESVRSRLVVDNSQEETMTRFTLRFLH